MRNTPHSTRARCALTRALGVALIGALALACSSTDDSTTQDAGATPSSRCTGPVDTYTAGIEKMSDGGSFKVAIVNAAPAPPDKGDNSWTIRVQDAGGASVTAALVKVRPVMPEHGHGTAPTEFEAKAVGDGSYTVGPMNLFMPGHWQSHVMVESGGKSEMAMFDFCLEG